MALEAPFRLPSVLDGQAAVLAELNGWGKLRFAGPDCRKFLNGLVTCDILNLAEGRGSLACVLTPQGKLVGDFAVYNRGADLLALQFPQAAAPVRGVFEKHAVLSRTEMSDATDLYGLWLFIGSAAAELLSDIVRRACGSEGPRLPGPWECRGLRWGAEEVYLLSYPRFCVPAWLLLWPAAKRELLSMGLMAMGEPYNLWFMPEDTFDFLRILSGIPVAGTDTDGNTFPAEANLDAALCYDKGCYLGQEITSRIKNLGHVNRRLAVLKTQNKVLPGAAVRCGGRAVGVITSAAPSPEPPDYAALAILPATELERGAPFEIVGPQETIPATRIS